MRAGPSSWLGVLLVCLSAALTAVFEALLTPLYLGGHLFPIAVALAVLSNVALPLLARSFVRTPMGTGSPFLVWVVVLIGFGVYPRPEGDVILPGGNLQWVSYGVILGGALAGIGTVVAAAPRRDYAAGSTRYR